MTLWRMESCYGRFERDEDMDDFERIIRESEEILIFAFDELKEARREQDEMRARQVCEKGYLSLIKAFNAFFVKRGKKVEELPQGERRRRYFLHTVGGRELENLYDVMRHRLHIEGFHEGIIIFDSLEEDLKEISKFVSDLKDGKF